MDESAVGQPRILLVDPDPARSARRCGKLSAQGWHAIAVGDPREALRVAATKPFDLALIAMSPAAAADMDLPGALQREQGCGFLPVIILSDDHASEQDRCRCLDSGADDILNVAIGSDELYARMQALLRIKHLQDALDDSKQALQDALRREQELIIKLQADNDLLHKQVVTDPLTRLYNVRYFEKFIADEFKIARRYDHALGLLMLDLDHFKMVNDRYGHPMGDFVLKEISGILTRNVRESDVVARTGGEEFAVILPRADREQANHFAERIRETVAAHTFVSGATRLKLTCSIGQACFGPDADVTSPTHLIHFADQALLAAKQAGRNRIMPWHELDEAVKARLRAQVRTAGDDMTESRLQSTPCDSVDSDTA